VVSKDEVRQFLVDFKTKMGIWQVLFRNDRQKNSMALLDLEITSSFREKVLRELEMEDYSSGPTPDTLNDLPDMWVFGKEIKKTEIYIKISMGQPKNPVICISFHKAEASMNYPLKKEKL